MDAVESIDYQSKWLSDRRIALLCWKNLTTSWGRKGERRQRRLR